MYRRKSRLRPILLAVILLILVAATTGTAAAKYLYRQQTAGKVTFTARLAENLLLQEREAVRQSDGSYKLSDKLVTENTYELLPGVDVPKDPFVTVVNKTPIEAYLYIEVVESVNGAIAYQVDETVWTKLDGVTGPKGGAVYVYHNGEILTNQTCPADPIPILRVPDGAQAQIMVSQKLLAQDAEGEDLLSFRAYLYEAYTAGGAYAAPADVFENSVPTA